MRLDVKYAQHVVAGDVVVGEVNLSAPTRPVQPYAAGMQVTTVTETEDGRVFEYGGLSSTAHPHSRLIMVVTEH